MVLVAQQAARVRWLRARGLGTQQPEELLKSMTATLAAFQSDLRRREAEAMEGFKAMSSLSMRALSLLEDWRSCERRRAALQTDLHRKAMPRGGGATPEEVQELRAANELSDRLLQDLLAELESQAKILDWNVLLPPRSPADPCTDGGVPGSFTGPGRPDT